MAGESTTGVDSSSKTQRRRTLELATRIGRRPLRVLVDLGSTGNYIDARECAARKMKIEAVEKPKELKMADGTMIKTEGRVQLKLKCGGYKGDIPARIFSNMNKEMILGIPWLSKDNPHIDWTRAAVVMKKGQDWILLPLAKSQQQNQSILPQKSVLHGLTRCSREKKWNELSWGLSDWSKRIQRGWKHRRSP